jgi:hypothetical protein
MRRKFWIPGIFAVGTFAIDVASAQPPRGGSGGNLWGDPESLFRRADKDGNGKITKDETQMLLPYFDEIDANKDGGIDLAELKAFAAAQIANSPGTTGHSSHGGEGRRDLEVEEERPLVYRFGKLPKEFPYAGLDTDEDGQVSLYEWRMAGKPIGEFLDRDLNGDGFLTAEEWLRGIKTSFGSSPSKDLSQHSTESRVHRGRMGR